MLLFCLAGKSIAQAPSALDSLFGTLFIDVDGDCMHDPFEELLPNWTVTASVEDTLNGGILTYSATTNADGYYMIDIPSGPLYPLFLNGSLIQVQPPLDFEEYCTTQCSTFNLIYPPSGIPSARIDYALQCDTVPPCPFIEVDIATNFLRPCFASKYSIYYQNYTSLYIPDATIQVTLDPVIQVTGANFPYSTNGNVYTFDLGTVNPFAWNQIVLDVFTPCDEPVGKTYCAEVHSFPDTCQALAGQNWDGSKIELNAACNGDQVIFTLKNVGTGNMTAQSEYIVIEDNVLLMQTPGQFQLNAGNELHFEYPANGSFYRMEADQSPGYPGHYPPIAWAEGCGSGGPVSFGFVNQYSMGDEDPWLDVFCIESVNSYDPNDKQGFPKGVGEKHYIDQNEDLEYLIRFQNTGTAPAINVVVRDTLPVHLDPNTLRRGASSHFYTLDIAGNGVLVFKFPNINLPDSNANQEASQGFVKFRISQRKDLPLETEIKNTAAIFFDFNDPIITNQTLHTIGKDFLSLSNTQSILDSRIQVQLMPNPAIGQVLVDVKGLENTDADLSFRLISMQGAQVLSGNFNGSTFTFDSGKLPQGIYAYEIRNKGQLAATGKVLKM